MSTGTAIHIGLNSVDPDAYEGWDGTLYACENDAESMRGITDALGYDTRILLTADATAEAVFGAISDAAQQLGADDICVITYAGHGGQFQDLGGEESDNKDETWLLYNREVLDDEIHLALAEFAEGVRVVVVSDSCHSGTVIRALYRELLEQAAVREAYERNASKLRSRARVRSRDRVLRLRGASPELQEKILKKHRARYEDIRARTPRSRDVDLAASVLLFSGCMDNQESAEQNGHGAFTAALLEEWAEGSFTGDYPALHSAILTHLPSTQSPNYLPDGVRRPEFEAQRPFTIAAPGGGTGPGEGPEEPGGAAFTPWVEGPAGPLSRSGSAPYFTAHTGPHPYYIFEIAGDPELFNGDREDDRDAGNWYSSWDDPEAPVRLEDALYWLPDAAWESLRHQDELWFRIGTTPADDSWEGYTVSTPDDRGEDAPSVTVAAAGDRSRAREEMSASSS